MGLLLNLLGCTRMATAVKDDFDVYIDNKLDNSISVYKLDAKKYIILLNKYF